MGFFRGGSDFFRVFFSFFRVSSFGGGGVGFDFFWFLPSFGFFQVRVYPRVKNKIRTQTRFYVGRIRVQVTGAKIHPNLHPLDAKLASYPKPEPEPPSLSASFITWGPTATTRATKVRIEN
jgi:hypothetical protein